MKESKKTKYRLLSLIEILKKYTDSNHQLNSSQIITYLQQKDITVTREVIYDDLKSLLSLDYDIIKTNSGYYINRDIELSDLKIVIDSITSTSFLNQNQIKSMIDRLLQDCSIYQRKIILDNTNYLKHNHNQYTIYNIDILMNAINNNKEISFNYFDLSFDPNTKKLYPKYRKLNQPYTLIPYATFINNNFYYCVGYSLDKLKFIHFRIDKMNNIQLLSSHNKLPFNLDNYISQSLNMSYGDKLSVTLLCDIELLNSLYDKFNTLIITSINKDTFTCNIHINNSINFINYILGFKSKIKIIKPVSLITQIKEYLNELNQIYK